MRRPNQSPKPSAETRSTRNPSPPRRRRNQAGSICAIPPLKSSPRFFDAKGLAALKAEDQREEWYADWLTYQAEQRLYATLLSPKEFSTLGTQFDLLRLTRFLEMFAYFSPAHGYSLQVTFLGFFSIMMGRTRN